MNCGGPAPCWAHCCCWCSSSRQPQHHYATSSAPQQKTTCTINQSMSIVTGVFPSLVISIKFIAQLSLCRNNKQPTQSMNHLWLLLLLLFQLWWASTSLRNSLVAATTNNLYIHSINNCCFWFQHITQNSYWHDNKQPAQSINEYCWCCRYSSC